MAITKEKKKEILAGLTDSLSGSHSMTFVRFHGLSVEHATTLRADLKKEDVGYRVAKKTLLRKALQEQSISGELPALEGEIAVAWSEDLTASAREVYAFQKAHEEEIQIVGGVFDGKYMSQEEMMEIATIPATPQLRGMFVNIINAPIQSFVSVLSKIAEKKEA